jgi:hypothetical protein
MAQAIDPAWQRWSSEFKPHTAKKRKKVKSKKKSPCLGAVELTFQLTKANKCTQL